MRPLILLAAVLAAPSMAQDSALDQPVADCTPCRFEIASDRVPARLIDFLWTEHPAGRVLDSLRVRSSAEPDETGQELWLDEPMLPEETGGRVLLLDDDLNGDGFADLGIVTWRGPYRTLSQHWLWQPSTRRFVPVERPTGATGFGLAPDPARGLPAHRERASGTEHVLTWYRFADTRLIPVRIERQFWEGDALMRRTWSLRGGETVEWAVEVASPDNPRADLRRDALAAHRRALDHYAADDPEGALAELESVFGRWAFDSLDPDDIHRAYTVALNDYGYFLERAGQYEKAVDVLWEVVNRAPDRLPAWLNLADAQWGAGYERPALASYRTYRDRMAEAGKVGRIPARVTERLDGR